MKTSELRRHRAPLLNLYSGQSKPQDAYVEIRPHEDGSAPTAPTPAEREV